MVFNDLNSNGIRDYGEPGLADIRVSNGRQVVLSDESGKWCLPLPANDEQRQDAEFFVIKPQGWMPPLGEHLLPKYFYLHRPEGSPKTRYAGSKETGPLPLSIDFPLHKQVEGDELRVLIYGDPQPRNLQEVAWMGEDVVEECRGFDGSFGIALGDIAFDNLAMFPEIASTLAETGIPWWMVLGNHDINYDAPTDKLANETFIANFGPANYAFDWGPAHFLILDNVEWVVPAEGKANYQARFSEEALEFARNELALVPKDRLVVAAMHIPLKGVQNGKVLLDLLAQFDYSVSVSGHTHTQRVDELGAQHGWNKAEAHTHVVHVTACGSWWSGEPDQRGIPHSTMRDGAPKGWLEWTFTQGKWKFDFRAAGEDASTQMHTITGDIVDGNLEVWVNVWNGDPRNKVEARLNSAGDWIELKRVLAPDPSYVALVAAEEIRREDKWRKLPEPINSTHLWHGQLRMADIWNGPMQVYVRVTDRWGRIHTERGVTPLPAKLPAALNQ